MDGLTKGRAVGRIVGWPIRRPTGPAGWMGARPMGDEADGGTVVGFDDHTLGGRTGHGMVERASEMVGR